MHFLLTNSGSFSLSVAFSWSTFFSILMHLFCSLLKSFKIEVQLLYNAVLVSAVQ